MESKAYYHTLKQHGWQSLVEFVLIRNTSSRFSTILSLQVHTFSSGIQSISAHHDHRFGSSAGFLHVSFPRILITIKVVSKVK